MSNVKDQKQLYMDYYARYFTLCIRYMGDRSLAEEVTNEGFLKVFQNYDQLNDYSLLEGWMKRIFINTCLGELRKKKYEFVEIEENTMKLYVERSSDHILEKMAMDDLLKMVAELPTQMRKVFNLSVIDGFKHHEIAEIMNISIGASKSHLHHARAVLQKKIIGVNKYDNHKNINSYG